MGQNSVWKQQVLCRRKLGVKRNVLKLETKQFQKVETIASKYTTFSNWLHNIQIQGTSILDIVRKYLPKIKNQQRIKFYS